MVLSQFLNGKHLLNIVVRSYLYTLDYSTLCFLPTALCTQNPHELLQYTAGFSAGSHSSRSPSTGSTNSTPATVHQLPKPKERPCKETFQKRRLYRKYKVKLALKMNPNQGTLKRYIQWNVTMALDCITSLRATITLFFFTSISFYLPSIYFASFIYQKYLLITQNCKTLMGIEKTEQNKYWPITHRAHIWE